MAIGECGEREWKGDKDRGLSPSRINTQTISGLMVRGRRKVLEGLVTAEVLGWRGSEVMGGEGCDAHGHQNKGVNRVCRAGSGVLKRPRRWREGGAGE